MGDVIPLRVGLKRYSTNNHVEFYAACIGESAQCKFFKPARVGGCDYANDQAAVPWVLCTNRKAHQDMLAKFLEEKQ